VLVFHRKKGNAGRHSHASGGFTPASYDRSVAKAKDYTGPGGRRV
jgi:hypothetical protein